MDGQSLILYGFLGSLVAGLMTAVGGLPVLFGRAPSVRLQNIMLGFAAGVMLSASFFSLIIPALEIAEVDHPDSTWPAVIVVLGILAGAGAMMLVNALVPHEHFQTGPEGPTSRMRRIWLFIFAITIHNFPEGMAVGVGFGSGDFANGMSLATGIGLQNLPEGLAVAVALVSEGYPRGRAFLVAAATGLVEPVGGLIGAAAITLAEPLLPWGLVFAAGAMLYVISHEIIPETHRRGQSTSATAGLIVGMVVMLFLDVTLG